MAMLEVYTVRLSKMYLRSWYRCTNCKRRFQSYYRGIIYFTPV